ncbi:7-cyano-7-deazaguanine synthase [Microvirga lotononidis]|uniref:7-cyano-7-deazaguanine synthase n=1 Tax=Microvirga lotononidis TaxID=864069 RepID=UPI001FDA4CC8|nr:7-cyano-7-deazaguanine synthase [Microvirga lotononidis]
MRSFLQFASRSSAREPIRSQPTRSKQGALVKTFVICSGGLDSVTLARRIVAERTPTRLMSSDHVQRFKKELASARACTLRLSMPHNIIDLSATEPLLAGLTPASSQVAGASSRTRSE